MSLSTSSSKFEVASSIKTIFEALNNALDIDIIYFSPKLKFAPKVDILELIPSLKELKWFNFS
jgi:hypothetical protein